MTELPAPSPGRQDLYDAALSELTALEAELAAQRKVLRRDWEALSSRERSALARQIKGLEERQAELEQTLELNVPLE